MRQITTMATTALLLTALGGCGTMANVAGYESLPLWGVNANARPPIPFGGVANDVRKIGNGRETMWPDLRSAEGTSEEFWQDYGAIPFLLLDMPLSLAGDIVTLPWATYWFVRGQNPLARPPEPETPVRDQSYPRAP